LTWEFVLIKVYFSIHFFSLSKISTHLTKMVINSLLSDAFNPLFLHFQIFKWIFQNLIYNGFLDFACVWCWDAFFNKPNNLSSFFDCNLSCSIWFIYQVPSFLFKIYRLCWAIRMIFVMSYPSYQQMKINQHISWYC
jgi:hypothetical protein